MVKGRVRNKKFFRVVTLQSPYTRTPPQTLDPSTQIAMESIINIL